MARIIVKRPKAKKKSRKSVVLQKPSSRRVPYHRVGIDPRDFSIRTKREWRYADRRPNVMNAMLSTTRPTPHLVLYDRAGVPRFTLRYMIQAKENRIVALSVQRERTQYRYLKMREGWLWDNELGAPPL